MRNTDTELIYAINVLTHALEKDEGYRLVWRANIAMAFYDEMSRASFPGDRETVHSVANKAAENFLKLLCLKPQPTDEQGARK